jgi:hypothetical protein
MIHTFPMTSLTVPSYGHHVCTLVPQASIQRFLHSSFYDLIHWTIKLKVHVEQSLSHGRKIMRGEERSCCLGYKYSGFPRQGILLLTFILNKVTFF